MKRLNWPQEAATTHRNVLALLQDLPDGAAAVAKVRAIAVRDEGGRWLPTFVRIDIARNEDIPLGPRYAYDVGVVALAEAMPVKELVRRLTATFERGEDFVCDGTPLIDDRLKTRWDADRLDRADSQNDYASWPCIHASCDIKQPTPKQEQGGPFVSARPDMHYHHDMLSLVREVAAFRTFHDWQDARRESANLIVWDYRGRIREARCFNDRVEIAIDGREHDLILKGRVTGRSASEPFQCDASEELSLSVPDDCTSVHMVLIGKDGDGRDGRDFNNYPVWVAGGGTPPATLDLGRLLREGETQAFEVKPWVRLPGDEKFTEVVETVAAMANSGGGTIAIGADRWGMLRWDETALEPMLKGQAVPDGDNAEEGRRELAVTRYARSIAERLQERINRSVELVASPERLAGEWLVCITVPEGDDPPYRDGEGGRIVVRRNASNRWPSDEELKEMLGSSPKWRL